jgi:G3E family GTPase
MLDVRIPVSVITGFLGSGKTTLVNHLVHHPGMAETAVIVNEFGEIGLDHELIEKSDENTILLGSGCLCCTVRGDLVDTLGSLSVRRLKGEVPPFKRVVIETTGLADPAPILHTLMSVPVVSRYCLDTVITTVDAVNGGHTLLHYEEAVKQVAVADRLLLTKADLSGQETADRLAKTLTELNPASPPDFVLNGAIDPADLFTAVRFDPETRTEEVRQWLQAERYDEALETDAGESEEKAHSGDNQATHQHARHGQDTNRHNDKISSFCMTFDEAQDWQLIALWLDSLVANQGEKLLRVKGMVDVEGISEPVVIHAVQHLFHPPVRIKAWPDENRQSRIVFITHDLPRAEVEFALDKAKKIIGLQTT